MENPTQRKSKSDVKFMFHLKKNSLISVVVFTIFLYAVKCFVLSCRCCSICNREMTKTIYTSFQQFCCQHFDLNLR